MVVLVVLIRGWLVRHLLTAASGLLPPLLPTADCPPKGKEEHQQTETLPVMDKNTPCTTLTRSNGFGAVNPPDTFQCMRMSRGVCKDPCAQMAAFGVCSGKAV